MKFIKLLAVVLISTLFYNTAQAQTVTVTAPNGGEVLYACQNYTITWSVTGSPSSYWDIDYSSNGGATWTSIASNYLSPGGTFVWTVPNLQSNTVIVRIKDSATPSTTDQSNSNFTINIPVTVTSPNGGETLAAGASHTITWTALGTSGTFNIYYSINGGSSWNTIVTNYSTGTGTYSWTVPNNPSTFCLVRVQDYVTGCMVDNSNANFTITAATPILLTPNGGEIVYIGCSYTITWNTASFYSSVMLEYSTNNGSSWNTIVSSTSNSGSYSWTVPNTASVNCLVRASNTANITINDVSNSVFTIAPAVVVTAPNGSEVLTGCSYYSIIWNKTTCVGNWNLYYSVNNGATWTNIVTNLGNTGSNTQSYNWYVPNNLSTTQALIKVESYSYPSTYFDVSNAMFTINPNQNITVSTPNGGESWNGCSTYNITWTKMTSPCNTAFELYYSLNNGTTWNYITSVSDNGAASQTYSWLVPNTLNSNQCLIRVMSSNWGNVFDVSNAVFTITPSTDITVTSPNGGEVWQGLTSQTITWSNLPAASGLYTVQYSINNGVSWNTLATNLAANSYNWVSVPNTPSTTCLVKVTDYLNTCKFDVSNATFTISPATPVMNSPNGGGTYNVGCGTSITWNAATYYSNIHLYYSTDNGATWISIISSTPNTGSYTWTVPNAPSANCLVKVANTSDLSVFDVSNAVFTIGVPLTVTAANGGESWNGCSTYNITWNKSTCIGNWNIYYSIDNGTTWSAIAYNVTNTGSVSQSYAWTVPNTITTTQALIKVENYSTPAIVDVSDAVFSITPSNDITVVTPNGGETLAAGSSYSITWTNLAGASGQYTLQYSINGGSSWITIVTNITGNSYSWTVPNASSSTCRIRVIDYINTCKNDQSNANFTITPAGSVLLTPNGGETLYIGCSYSITWASATFISNVYLEYSTNNGASWFAITSAAGVANTGSYNWTVPNTVSANCLVRASNTSNLSLNDVSDAVFTIAPGVTVTSPNGGETVTGCSYYTISWNKSTCVGNWNIHYSVDNGATWVTIATNVSSSGSNNQNYSWYVPNNLNSSLGLIRVQSTSGTYTDVSNANFTFTPNQNITLVSPNGGEVWAGCSSYNITWTKMTSPCNTSFGIYYSTNNGTTWNFISSVADNGAASQTYTWNPVPNSINSATCLIKVQSSDWSNIFDASNAVLTIAPSNDITVTSPNGGEVWQGLSSHTITWTNLPAASGLYTVQYSTNNGSTWTNIVTNYSGNSYAWSVPNSPSTQCQIKVIDYLNSCKFDVTDANFTISPATPVMTAPNGGQVFNIGCATNITWNSATYYSNVHLYYSTDNGTTWVSIITSTGNTGSYTWTIPTSAIPSGNCLVKVANTADLSVYDISDANFTIAVPLTLISPNGGEAWAGCSSYNITWNKSNCIGNWNIYYSANNGATWIAVVINLTNAGGATQTYTWSLPNNISTTQALIKVENYTTPAIFDVSDAVFSITPSSDITVIAPNGGEVISSLSTYTISWSNTVAASGQYTVQYSTNGGGSYTNIVTNYTGNTYNWSVPSLNSTNCMIRVIDFLNTCKNDASDAVFTITPPTPVLLTPNGGETLYIGCSYSITWNSTTFTGPVKLDYSTNGGITYFPIIASTSNTGSYNWTVPNTQSVNCKVRASLASDPTILDVSDASFVIAPAILVTSPNGGETLTGCSTHSITWNKSTCIGNFNIHYSLDNGSTWNVIVSNLSNSGSPSQTYNWYVPNNLTTTQGLIRVQTTSAGYSDVSNSVFTINPNNNITLTTPNGGETFTTCQSYNITWNKMASPCNTGFDLYYSLNNGTSWIYITSVTDNGAASQTYSWTVPNSIVTTSTQALVRVVSSNWVNISDQSNAVFTINPNADITVTSANGGEVWQGLSTQTITWNNSIFASGLYNIDYSTNGGSTWTNITTNYFGNSYSWSVPNTPSTTCRIRVTDYLATCRYDISNANFTISPATPIMLTPNGAEVLNSGQSYNITWNAATYYSNVNLYYSVNNGVSWTTIATNSANDGTHTWTPIPNENSTTCLVKVANFADVTVFDVSNAVFTIKPAVKIITPNGGENLAGCTVTSITWERSPAWNTYKIEYSNNNGTTWYLITSSYVTGANPATYTWTLPNIASTQTLVRVTPTLATANYDQSDNVFTITRPVTIIQPNFGGTMMVGSVFNITWNSDGISNLYDIFYSTNGGATFTNIVTAYNTATNVYAWTVPATPSTTCKIWVRDNTASCKSDTSDVNFTISSTAPPITLLTPNGGETLTGCFSYNITWTDSPSLGTYDILYSTNSGSTWNNIVTGYTTASQSYNWTIPNTINSSTCLIRVRSTSTPTTFDQSDALLAIYYGNMVAFPSDTTVCAGQPVQLTATGGVNYTWTPAAGLSCTTCSNPIATPGTTTTYTVTSNNGGCILTDTAHVSVFTASVAIAATPSTSICFGTNVTFTATPTNGGTAPAYQWYLDGAPVGTNSPTYSNNALTNGAQVYVVLTSNAPCLVTTTATSPTITMNVTSIPATPGTVSGSTPVCSGTSNTYSIVPVSGATSYTWTLPGGWTGTSTTTSITSTASTNSGNITVTAGNGCGNSSAQTLAVVVEVIPSTPGTISGPSTICSGTSNTYSIAAVSGATTYTWTLPGGWTGTSTTNSITTTASTTSGNITVTAGNMCGNSAAQTFAVVVNTTPATPGTITGTTPICDGTSNTYSIAAVSGATSYTWTLPGGWTGTSTTASITTTASTTSGNVTVTANNGCGSSAVQTLAVVVNSIPAAPGTISGPTTLCQGTSNTYSVTAVSGAASYTWSLPGGWTGTSSTNSITSTASATGGNITVTANNMCGNSSPQTLAVTVTPLPSLTAGGTATICSGTSTALSASGATSYSWLPVTGLSDPSISNPLAAPASTTTYTVTGTTSGCSSTATVTITVTPSPVVTVSGTTGICDGGSTTLTASGATSYSWSPSTGLSNPGIANPVASPSVTTTYTVTGTTGVCTGTATVTITVNPIPTVVASGTATICSGAGTPLGATGATSYSWLPVTGLSNASISNPTASPATTTTYTVTGTTGGCSATDVVTVTVNTVPADAGADAAICAGGSTSLNATGGTSYAWSPASGLSATNIANPTATPSGTTSYTVTVTSGSCSATDVVVVTVNSIPSANAGSDVAISCGASTTLSASGGTSYAWSPSAGLSSTSIANPVATPAATTTYTVTVTTAGCTGTDAVTVTVNGPTVDAGPYTTICAGTSTVLSGTVSGAASSYAWLSAQRFGSTSFDVGYSTCVDGAGNQYITGSFNGTVAFGSFNLTASGYDVFVAKLNPAGTVLWAVKGGGTSTDEGRAIAVDPSGNVYVSATFFGTATFGATSLSSSGSADVALLKYNSTGTLLFAVKAVGGVSSDNGHGLTADASGAWLTGNFALSATFGAFTLTTSSSTNYDMYIAKYNTSGVCQWAQKGGSTSSTGDGGYDVGVDAIGNAYVTGYFSGTATFGGFTVFVAGTSTDYDAFVAKYNSTGTIQWIRKGGIAGYGEIGRGIAVDASGNCYAVGGMQGTPSFGALSVTSNGSTDAFLIKYNTTGTEQWLKNIGGTSSDNAYGVTIDPSSGNIFITGSGTSSSIVVGPSSLGAFGSSGQTYIAQFSTTGTALFGIKSNSPSPAGDGPTRIGADNSGNVYIIGTFNSSGASSTAVFGATTLTGTGGGDVFIAKMGPSVVTTYAWTPATGLSSTTVASPTATPAVTTTYTLTVNSGGCSGSDTVTVAVVPGVTANAGSDAAICNGSSTTLNASGGTTYSWLPATGLSSTSIANPVANPTVTTSYTVTVSVGSCSATDVVMVTVNPTPTANAGVDQTIACGGSTTLSGSGGGTYSWSPATGLSNPNIANPVCTPATTTTYTLTVSNGTCSSTDQVTITTGTLTANAGADVSICTGSSTTLTGSSTGGGSGPYVNLATSYTFNQNVATYTAITGGTVFLNGASPSMDDVVSGAIAIPAFTYNNITYTSIYISTNGFITFGSAPTTTNYIPISSTETYAGAIAGFGTDVNKATTGTPEIRYQTIGTEFVVQFRDVGRYDAGGTLDRLSFQIRLNTVGNTVKVVYDNPALVGAATFDPMVGLRGPNNTYSTNVHNRLVLSSTGPWVNSTQGTTNASVCFIDASVPATKPAAGTTFTWSPPSAATSTYSWSPSTGLSCTTCTSPVATPTTTTTYTLTVNNGSCTAVDMVTVTVGSSLANAGPDVSICTGGSTTLNASGATTYSWSPSTGLSATNIANPVASPSVTTSYTVTATTGSCSTTDVVVVTVNTMPVANAGSDVSICAGSSTTLNASGGASYSWSPATGLSSATIANPSASPSATTTYTVTVSNGSCSATDVVVVTVNPAPAANAGADVSICTGGSTTLNASGGTTYAWLPATGLSATNIANPVATPAATTTYTVTVGNGSCTATDVVVVTVNTITANAGADVSICSGNSTTLNATGGTGYAWSPSAGLSSTSISNPVANPTVTTSYTVTVTSGSCTATDVMVVTVNPVPSANAGSDVSICAGSSTTLSASGGASYSWSPGAGLSSTSIANPAANPSSTTSYTVTVTTGACSATDVVVVTVVPMPLADAGTNVAICSGSSTTLNASGGTTYSWIPATGLSATNIANPVATPSATTTYTVIVSNGSCSATDFVTVTVNSMPVAPASISGMDPACSGTTQVYSVAVDPDITSYNWILPGGWSGSSTTNSISTTVGASSGVVLVTASNACGSASPVTKNVTVNTSPTVTMSSLGTICIGAAPFTITAGSPAGGVYSGTGVSNDTTFTPSAAGAGTFTITYVYTDGNGCSGTAGNTVIVDLCTDIAANTIDGGIMVYPNPFSDYAVVQIDQSIQLNGAAIMVYDMVGKNVLNYSNINTYTVTIDRRDLQAGAYFYRFINAEKVIATGKLIIN